jgi:hypothetical protein
MKSSEELAIDNQIIKATEHAYISLWSILDKDKTFYNNSLAVLLHDGKMPCSFSGPEDTVGLARILNHIGLPFRYITNGFELKEGSKVTYRENKMYRKTPQVTHYRENRFNSVGKDEPDENKLGWNERRNK